MSGDEKSAASVPDANTKQQEVAPKFRPRERYWPYVDVPEQPN